MGSVFGTLFKIVEGTSNMAQGKGYVSNEHVSAPIKNVRQNGQMKYLIEETAEDGRSVCPRQYREKFCVFADSPVEAKEKFKAMFMQMHDWSERFECRILKSWDK